MVVRAVGYIICGTCCAQRDGDPAAVLEAMGTAAASEGTSMGEYCCLSGMTNTPLAAL
jgi:hypothetical protein